MVMVAARYEGDRPINRDLGIQVLPTEMLHISSASLHPKYASIEREREICAMMFVRTCIMQSRHPRSEEKNAGQWSDY